MKVLGFKAYSKGTLEGFAELALDSGLVIRGMTYHKKEDQRWLGFPTKSYENESGETKWQNILYIADDGRWKKFQQMALAALDEFFASNQATGTDDDVPF